MSNASLASGRSGHRGPTEPFEVDVVMEEPPTELHPLLSERHVNMITFSCCIGVGLFLQCGHVIYLAGPGMAIIAYLLTGSIIWSAMACLGEMTALFPISGPLFQFPCRYLDQGIGYAVGWMAWFAWIVILAAELLAVTQLFKFEFQDTYLEMVGIDQDVSYAPGILAVNPAVWVLLFWIVILVINFMPIRWYGELEYLFGSFKMAFIIGLIMFNIVISAMGQGYREVNPSNPFWTYTNPYGFWSNNITINSTAISNGSETSKALTIDGSKGRFLAIWTAMTAVAFSMIGFETVAITAAENKDLRNQETVKIATRKITLRILVLYTLSAFTAGLNVPYTDENLANFAANSIRSGEYSIFVLAAVRSRLPGWAKFFNGVFIFSATTSAINSLYLSSRLLHALASDYNAWPRLTQHLRARLSITKYGVPMAAVFTSWLFGSLAFLSSGREPTQVLSNLATNSVVSMLIVYTVICASYLRFDKVREERARGVGLEDLSEIDRQREMRKFNRRSPRYPYKSHWQWLRAVYALVGCLLMVLFLGWASFLEPFHPGQFVAAYISIPVFLILTIAYHVKLDESNPFNWSLKHNDDMSDPMTVANPDDRRGRLKFNLKGNPVTLNNARNVLDFVWAWMK